MLYVFNLIYAPDHTDISVYFSWIWKKKKKKLSIFNQNCINFIALNAMHANLASTWYEKFSDNIYSPFYYWKTTFVTIYCMQMLDGWHERMWHRNYRGGLHPPWKRNLWSKIKPNLKQLHEKDLFNLAFIVIFISFNFIINKNA